MKIPAKWIRPEQDMGMVCPLFRKGWSLEEAKDQVSGAVLHITALGVYEAKVNRKAISDYVLAPGWTEYKKRIQKQTYDIKDLLQAENMIEITVGKGWYRSRMPGWYESEDQRRRMNRPCGLLAWITIDYRDGTRQTIVTDSGWSVEESGVRFSEIYDGEIYNAAFSADRRIGVCELEEPPAALISQEGEKICEHERILPKEIFKTPAGELVVDFGQEVTGWVEFHLSAHAGDLIRVRHGEILDADGNFYNENYRSAKAELTYICKEGEQIWHPGFTYFGFRYIVLDQYPIEPEKDQFIAVAVYSDIRQTGYVRSGNQEINQLFRNILWGQKGNFLDVPTDCPQRDERLGWTGDAQVFIKAATYNFDTEKFYRKWLRDLALDQRPDGGVSQVVPDYMPETEPSAGWGDAAVICPWQVYRTYGNKEVLEEQFPSMKRWVDYIQTVSREPYLWIGGEHFGDWCGLDSKPGEYKGASREEFIASAFYAYSVELLIKSGEVLGYDMSEYSELHQKIVKAFRRRFARYTTQTECILSIQFGLAEDPQEAADHLAELIRQNQNQMATGFIGTPYLLHVLTDYGYEKLAYDLLLRKDYPSWLYSVGKGATTIWEHWDGIMEDGSFWSPDMNSMNHYAYGAVADWLYEKAAGIISDERCPGFEVVHIEPHTDPRIGWLDVSLHTRHGLVRSFWEYQDHSIRYEVQTDMPAEIMIDGEKRKLPAGTYIFWGED